MTLPLGESAAMADKAWATIALLKKVMQVEAGTAATTALTVHLLGSQLVMQSITKSSK